MVIASKTYKLISTIKMPTTPDLNEADEVQVPLAKDIRIDMECPDCKLKSETTDKGHTEKKSEEPLNYIENRDRDIVSNDYTITTSEIKSCKTKHWKRKSCSKRIILTFVALDILIVNVLLISMYIPVVWNSQRSETLNQVPKTRMLFHVNKNATTYIHDSRVHWTVDMTSSNIQNRNIEYKDNKIIVHQDGVYAIILDLSLNTNLDRSNKRDGTHGINICLKTSEIQIACDRKRVNVGWMGKAHIHIVGRQLSKGTEVVVTVDERVKAFIREYQAESYFYIVQL